MENEIRKFFNESAPFWDNKEVKSQPWLSQFINEYLPLKKGMKTLDLGCGTGIISDIIYRTTETKVVAMDLSDKMIEIAKKKYDSKCIEFVVEDFYLTKKSGYDMIVCFNAYPHFVKREFFKEKAKEVLNENGYLAIIHSLSRLGLAKCHKGLTKTIARELNTVDEESNIYSNDFDIIEKIDNDDMFMLLMRKKSN